MPTPKRLFIIDAMAMAFRTFHAFGARPMTNDDGLPTSAIFGSAQFLFKLIEDEKPDYLAIASDCSEPTFRHQMYSQYKANRPPMPEELAAQIPYLYQLFGALGCPVIKAPGFEADDLIGSLVSQNGGPDLHCYIVSGDKDFMQLINPHTFLYAPKSGGTVKIVDEQGVHEKFGCSPEQVIDALAIIGDASDHVPGVKGIGDKGAAKLIQEFGSLENIYQNLDKITNKRQQTALETSHDEAHLSRRLVTIKTDIEELPSLSEMRFDPATALAKPALLDLFKKLNFRRLTQRVDEAIVQAESAALEPAQSLSPDQNNLNYQLVDTQAKLDQLLECLKEAPLIAFDTETTGLDIISDEPIGFSFSTEEGQGFYLPLVSQHLKNDLTPEAAVSQVEPLLADPSKTFVGHNIKFDLQMLRNMQVELSAPIADTMICSYLLEPTSKSHGLDACALKYLNIKKIPTSDLIGKKGETSMLDVPLGQLSQYACEDADVTLRLFQLLHPLVIEKGLQPIYQDIEIPLIRVLAKMEQNGVYLNSQSLGELSVSIEEKLVKIRSEIYSIAEEEFNINSTKQLQNILFEKLKVHEVLGVKKLKKNKSGYSTDVSVLESLSQHPLPKALLSYRTLTKLKGTYIDALPALVNPKSERLHTQYHQTGTATGRLSSSNPNLQNIPIRSPLGKEIRAAFCTDQSDQVLISADYSQIELRVLAHMSGDESLLEAFRNNIDIHRTTAAKIFDVEPASVDDNMRSQAKAINFGIIYGMGPSRLSKETGVSFSQAKQFIEKYFERYPKVKQFVGAMAEQAKQTHQTTTISGRIRPIEAAEISNNRPGARFENIAVNTPIQGSAADMIKIAMVRLDQALTSRGLKSRMLLQVHDELIFQCPKQELDETVALIKETMESSLPLKTPVAVEVGSGSNWLEAH